VASSPLSPYGDPQYRPSEVHFATPGRPPDDLLPGEIFCAAGYWLMGCPFCGGILSVPGEMRWTRCGGIDRDGDPDNRISIITRERRPALLLCPAEGCVTAFMVFEGFAKRLNAAEIKLLGETS
jgi:hypothetical protein